MQFSKYISFDGENGAIMVNNYDWLSKINMIEFLRDYGKNFNINYMLSKETVASRLETGISYTEFSYMIIQSIDFLHLYEKYNCKLQFGGSDQWGNITAGLDLIRKKLGDNEKVLGMTSPLLTKSDGTKISKSEGGAIWLDKDKTSSYELYQFFLNTTDADVINYLKTPTLLDRDVIERLEETLKLEPEKRVAQKTLAYEIVKFVHGYMDADGAKNSSEEIFSNNGMSENMPTIELSLEDNMPVVDLLLSSNLVSSKSEARRLIEQGGITINQEHITNVDEVINIKNEVIIQKGKKTYLKVKVK
jgi:tyrosyl-tRNA synthetase